MHDTFFTSEDKLKQHTHDYSDCHYNTPAKTENPTKDKAFVEFKNHKNKFKCPFVIYADFESIFTKSTKQRR